jgi:hypothetical protein
VIVDRVSLTEQPHPFTNSLLHRRVAVGAVGDQTVKHLGDQVADLQAPSISVVGTVSIARVLVGIRACPSTPYHSGWIQRE